MLPQLFVRPGRPGRPERLDACVKPKETKTKRMLEPDEFVEAKLEKNSSTLFTTETRSTRSCTENPDASVKSPCPPCLRGETGRLAAAGSPSESQK